MPVALVTGGSRGIGRETALRLGTAGFDVAVVARTRGDLDAVRDLLAERGTRACSFVVDASDSAAIGAVVSEIELGFGPIELLVNNAGTLHAVGPLWTLERDDWWTDIRSSLGSAFACSREVLPGMIARRSGRVVNLGSYAAARPAPYEAAYAAAKAGIASLTESLAASLEDYGVKAFTVAPAYTATAMTDRLTSRDGRRWFPELAGRKGTNAALTADLIVWLASGAGDALSGRILHTLDDVGEIARRLDEVLADDLYVPRLRRLPP